jgi:hypothetical protein
MLKPEQIETIRSHYERGKNPSEIARIVPFKVTRQAIEQRAKRGEWKQTPAITDTETQALVIPDGLPAKQTQALEHIRCGASHSVAYRAVGIPASTWNRWLKDPEFGQLVSVAQAQAAAPVIKNAYDHALTDPKWSWEWLQKSPGLRDEFGQAQQKGPQINIKLGHLIPRDPAHKAGRVIDQD